MKNIKAVMDKHLSHVKFDAKLMKRIEQYIDAFRTKNEDHIHFFGSNSFGVYKVVYSTLDRLDWLTDVLDIDELEVRNDLVELPSIKKDWKKYTDVVNMSCVYMIYRFYKSALMPELKQHAMTSCAMVLNVKALTSFMNQSFQFLTTEETSEKVYNNLSYKYSLKKTGNWYNLLLERSEDMISPKSIHYNVVKNFEPDPKVLYMISDTITRVKSIVKNLYDEMIDVKQQETKHLRSSMMVEMEEGTTVRDVAGQYDNYKNYIETTLRDRSSFIRSEVANVVLGLVGPGLPPPVLSDAVVKFYEQYNKGNKLCTELLDLILLHAFQQIQQDKDIQKKADNIAEFLVYMHSLYGAPRAKGDIEKIRDIGGKFVKKFVKSNNSTIIASARTGLVLYILARTFLKDKN